VHHVTNKSQILVKSDFSVNPTCRSRGSRIPDNGFPDSHPEVGPRICLQKWVPVFASRSGSPDLPPEVGPRICFQKWVPGFASGSWSRIYLRKWVPRFASGSGSPDLPPEVSPWICLQKWVPGFVSRSRPPDLPPEVSPRICLRKWVPGFTSGSGFPVLPPEDSPRGGYARCYKATAHTQCDVSVQALFTSALSDLPQRVALWSEQDNNVSGEHNASIFRAGEHIDLSVSKGMI
jgi:hypothetical protein